MIDHDDGSTRVRAAIADDVAFEAAAAVVATLDIPPPAAPVVAPAAAEDVEAGPLPPPPRKYLRPSAYWADRWITVTRP